MMQLPTPKQRMIAVGSTGSGKSALCFWHLSKRNFTNRTIIIIDPKRDSNLAKIKAKVLPLNKKVPTDGGVYIYRPMPIVDDQALDDLLLQIWKNENYLVYFDELATLRTNNRGFIACLTQGRDKNIEMIMCTQRPVDVSRYVFSETEYMALMKLNDKRDIKKIQDMVDVDLSQPIDKYYSRWIDKNAGTCLILAPVPEPLVSIEIINRKISGLTMVV
jgi:hypothetical protein